MLLPLLGRNYFQLPSACVLIIIIIAIHIWLTFSPFFSLSAVPQGITESVGDWAQIKSNRSLAEEHLKQFEHLHDDDCTDHNQHHCRFCHQCFQQWQQWVDYLLLFPSLHLGLIEEDDSIQF